MCRIDLCGQIGVKISSYGDRIFKKFNPLNRPWGRFLRREDTNSLRSTWPTWKNTTLSPPSPPHQKYLENVKKVKKTTKSAIFLVIYY